MKERGIKALADAARAGQPPPELDIHPDDVTFDPETSWPVIDAPLFDDQKQAQNALRAMAAEIRSDYSAASELLKAHPKNKKHRAECIELGKMVKWLDEDDEKTRLRRKTDFLRAETLAPPVAAPKRRRRSKKETSE